MINIIVTSLIAAVAVFTVGVNIPINYLAINNPFNDDKLGAFTELTSTNLLSNFPATYNANLAKSIEVGTTSIPTITTLAGLTTANALTSATSLSAIGTITTGVWTGSVIGDDYGGTGFGTYSTGDILYASGANTLSKLVIGSAGQSLVVSGGVPAWSNPAINTAANYTWTGQHIFSATTTIPASSVTNNALVLNSIPYRFPPSITASSTVLSTDASGNLSWVDERPKLLLANTATNSFTGTTATTTVFTYTLAANELGAGNQVEIDALCRRSAGAGSTNNRCAIQFGTGSASTTISIINLVENSPSRMRVRLTNNAATNAQTFVGEGLNGANGINTFTVGTDARDTTAQLYISFQVDLGDGTDTLTVQGITITKY